MKRLLISSTMALMLLGCSDDSSISRPGQNLQVEQQPARVAAEPQSNTTQKSAPSAPETNTASPQLEVKDTFGKAKKKTREISRSMAGSTKSWKENWTKMNKNRIKADDSEQPVVPDQKADMGAIKQSYNAAKQVVVDTSRTAVDKAKELAH